MKKFKDLVARTMSPRSSQRTTEMRKLIDFTPVPAGDVVTEYLVNSGLTRKQAAKLAQIPLYTFARVCTGDVRIDQTIAEGLERVFGRPAHFWLNLQQQFDAR